MAEVLNRHSLIEAAIIYYRADALLEIGERCYIGRGTEIRLAERVSIGNDVLIASDCYLCDTEMHSLNFEERSKDVAISLGLDGLALLDKDWSVVRSAPIVIHDKVWVGVRSMILAGSAIGEGAVIGAGSVVRGYVAPYSVYAGNPARLIRKLK